MTKTIILIPSRLAATRLPNKPLLKINGKSIINRVYEKAKSSKSKSKSPARSGRTIIGDIRDKIDKKDVIPIYCFD